MEAYPTTFIAAKQGGLVLFDNYKFKYSKDKTNAGKTKCYYKCAEKKMHNCEATATVCFI